jgi:CheY-like chemotaxis protein
LFNARARDAYLEQQVSGGVHALSKTCSGVTEKDVNQPEGRARAPLEGLRVLVVEDQYIIAEDLSQILTDWGCTVLGPAASVGSALEIVEAEELDGAILDVNLGNDELSFPVAAALQQRQIPFVFVTGYAMADVFPPEYEAIPKLSKPVRADLLAAAVGELGRESGTGS